jgi:hypothetical protein
MAMVAERQSGITGGAIGRSLYKIGGAIGSEIVESLMPRNIMRAMEVLRGATVDRTTKDQTSRKGARRNNEMWIWV